MDKSIPTMSTSVQEPQELAVIEQGVQDPLGIPPAPKKRSAVKLFAIIIALYVSLFLAALDFTIVSTAIPTIANQFHSSSGYAWIGSAYLLASAASVPQWGKLSDIWGRRPILLAAVAMFIVGSVLCAVSVNMTMLLVGRAVQGSAAGGLTILVNICISDLFSMRERGFWIGLSGATWAVASGTGPVLGGAFTQKLSWRWIWWINLPCSGLAFVLILLFLDVHNPKTPFIQGLQAIDWYGSVTIIGVTIMLLLGLEFGGITFPWDSPKVICLIVFGLFMIILFLYSQVKLARYPLIPMRIFKHRSNVATLLVCFSHGFTFISSGYFLPLYFQAVGECTPVKSGLLVVPIAVTQSVVGIGAGVFIRRTGRYREPIWIGMAFLTLGYGLFIAFTGDFSVAKAVAFEIVAGTGIGLVFLPPLIALQSMVEQPDIASATATYQFVRNIATSLSIVIGSVVFQNGMQTRSSNLHAVLPTDVLEKFTGQSAASSTMMVEALEASQKIFIKAAYADSLRYMWVLYTCTAALGLLASCFISKQTLSTEHTETKTGLNKDN